MGEGCRVRENRSHQNRIWRDGQDTRVASPIVPISVLPGVLVPLPRSEGQKRGHPRGRHGVRKGTSHAC